jgi:hypothetical protein
MAELACSSLGGRVRRAASRYRQYCLRRHEVDGRSEQGRRSRDPAAKVAFGCHLADAVDRALADPLLLHGQRTEAMFEALLVSLGEFRLLTAENTGPVFPAEPFRAPDFRVVLFRRAHAEGPRRGAAARAASAGLVHTAYQQPTSGVSGSGRPMPDPRRSRPDAGPPSPARLTLVQGIQRILPRADWRHRLVLTQIA